MGAPKAASQGLWAALPPRPPSSSNGLHSPQGTGILESAVAHPGRRERRPEGHGPPRGPPPKQLPVGTGGHAQGRGSSPFPTQHSQAACVATWGRQPPLQGLGNPHLEDTVLFLPGSRCGCVAATPCLLGSPVQESWWEGPDSTSACGSGFPTGWASRAVPTAWVRLPVPVSTLGWHAAPRLAPSLVESRGQSPAAGTGQALEDGGRGRKGGPGTGPSPDVPTAPAVGTGGSLAHTDEGLRWLEASVPVPHNSPGLTLGCPPSPAQRAPGMWGPQDRGSSVSCVPS